jgi:hypothetical protein
MLRRSRRKRASDAVSIHHIIEWDRDADVVLQESQNPRLLRISLGHPGMVLVCHEPEDALVVDDEYNACETVTNLLNAPDGEIRTEATDPADVVSVLLSAHRGPSSARIVSPVYPS